MMNAFWDFDSTIMYNIFDLDYHRFIYTKSGVKQFKKFCRLNPIVNTTDVKHVLTARAPYNNYNEIHKDLKRFGINAELYLNKNQRKNLLDDIKFKADILNKHKPQYYIDDDDFMNRALQPYLTHTRCITTEQYYILNGGN
jgi:hypothetical protein